MNVMKPIKVYTFCTIFAFAVPIYSPMDVTKYPNTPVYDPNTPVYDPDTPIYYPIDGDSDGDGIPNSRDAFPGNPNEWLDTDHDGIGNNADTDDDNDSIPDSVERANHLNPLNASDAAGDLDRDGFSNVIEYTMGTNMRSASSHPTWTPIIMGNVMIFIPAK